MNTRQRRKTEVTIQRAHIGMVPCPHCVVPFTAELMSLHIERNHPEAVA